MPPTTLPGTELPSFAESNLLGSWDVEGRPRGAGSVTTRAEPYHFGYVLTDTILFHPHLGIAEKLVLGATLSHPNRNPSQPTLAKLLPIQKRDIQKAQHTLEGFELARYDRPSFAWEREAHSPRFRHSNKLVWVAPEADPSRSGARSVTLPGEIARRLPAGNGKKNAKLFPLVALVYAREQLRRTIIHIEDEAVAALLGLSERQVRRVREELRTLGLLKFSQRKPPCDAYTFPGATAGIPAAQLDPAKTRRIRRLGTDAELGFDGYVPVYANEAEWETIAGRARRLGPLWTNYALTLAFGAELGGRREEAPFRAASVLQSMEEAATAKADFWTGVDRTAPSLLTHSPQERPLPSTPQPSIRTSKCDEAAEAMQTWPTAQVEERSALAVDTPAHRDSGKGERLTEGDKGGERPERDSPRNRRFKWDSTYFGVHYYATLAIHEQIEEYVQLVETKYGHEEAAGFLREYALASRASGRTILARFKQRFEGIRPVVVNEALAGLLAPD